MKDLLAVFLDATDDLPDDAENGLKAVLGALRDDKFLGAGDYEILMKENF